MFEQLDEDLNNLASMKLSQYYKTFEEEIMQWDDKLQKVRIVQIYGLMYKEDGYIWKAFS